MIVTVPDHTMLGKARNRARLLRAFSAAAAGRSRLSQRPLPASLSCAASRSCVPTRPSRDIAATGRTARRGQSARVRLATGPSSGSRQTGFARDRVPRRCRQQVGPLAALVRCPLCGAALSPPWLLPADAWCASMGRPACCFPVWPSESSLFFAEEVSRIQFLMKHAMVGARTTQRMVADCVEPETRPVVRYLEHWLQAERELAGDDQPNICDNVPNPRLKLEFLICSLYARARIWIDACAGNADRRTDQMATRRPV